jgi:hypothetical protein
LLEHTRRLLGEPQLDGEDPDEKICNLIKAEYLRRSGRYRRVDLLMTQKYGMTFDEFIRRRIVKEHEYGWNVELDAMDWETAVAGIKTMKRKIQELEEEKQP